MTADPLKVTVQELRRTGNSGVVSRFMVDGPISVALPQSARAVDGVTAGRVAQEEAATYLTGVLHVGRLAQDTLPVAIQGMLVHLPGMDSDMRRHQNLTFAQMVEYLHNLTQAMMREETDQSDVAYIVADAALAVVDWERITRTLCRVFHVRLEG